MPSTFSPSCGPKTDIWFFYTSAPAGFSNARGATQCARPLSFGICDVFWIGINPAQIFSESFDSYNYLVNLGKTIRHEIGHTTGLRHSNGGGMLMAYAPYSYLAMRSGAVSSSGSYYLYAGHHVGHINATY